MRKPSFCVCEQHRLFVAWTWSEFIFLCLDGIKIGQYTCTVNHFYFCEQSIFTIFKRKGNLCIQIVAKTSMKTKTGKILSCKNSWFTLCRCTKPCQNPPRRQIFFSYEIIFFCIHFSMNLKSEDDFQGLKQMQNCIIMKVG